VLFHRERFCNLGSCFSDPVDDYSHKEFSGEVVFKPK
jgi:hypothetical protein